MAGGDKEVHIFPKGISPKVNVIVRLEFELAVVQYFSYYAIVRRERKKSGDNDQMWREKSHSPH